MENCSDVSTFFDEFCNCQNLFKYIEQFYNSFENSKCDPEVINIPKFLRCLQYLNRSNVFEIETGREKFKEFSYVLLKIYDTFCSKYFTEDIVGDKNYGEIFNSMFLFESISLLIKVLASKFNCTISLKPVFLYINSYFQRYNLDHENYCVDSDKLHHILKLFVDILKSFDSSNFSKHISDEVLIDILSSLPFSDKYSVNVFVNQIVPCLFSKIDHALKKDVLELIWGKIVTCHKENLNEHKQSHHYSLLCCFSDLMFKEHEMFDLEDFYIYNDDIWEIIQSGLMSDNSFNRKQAIYIFKVILFWLKTKGNVTSVSYTKLPLFIFDSVKDLMIWNDLVLLFETLEEKQIHVIKPVLPKFSRILQHSSNLNSTKSFSLHPSWITCFIRRMIFHESKFIMKQGLSVAMNINFKECLIHKFHSEEFIQVLITGFNDQSMYSRMDENDNLSLFLSSEKISVFLTEYITAFETVIQKVEFLRYLLKLIASESWCGIALMHLIFALTKISSLPSWKSQDVIFLREIIQGSFKSHESIIREAIEYWLIKSCILFIDWNSFSFEEIVELLFTFKSLECHTEIWNAVASKLEEVFIAESSNLSVHKAQEFSLNCINRILTPCSGSQKLSETDLHKMARILMILSDSSIISVNFQEKALNWSHILQPLTSILIDAPKRPYMSQEKFFNALQFYTLLIDTSQGNTKNINDVRSSAIIKSLNCSVEFAEFLYQKSLMDIKGSNDIIDFKILYNSLLVLSSSEDFHELFLKLLPSFLENYNRIPQQYLSKKAIIILFYSISSSHFKDSKSNKLISDPVKGLNHSLLLKIIDEHVIEDLSKSVFVNEMEKEVWQKLATNTICKFWDVTSCQYIDQDTVVAALVQLAKSTFDGSSKSTYAFTINCIKTLVPKLALQNIDMIEDLFASAWRACLELHGSEAYRPAINSFIYAVFQPCMLNEKCLHILYKYLDLFQTLSENTVGIFYLVIKQFCDAFPLESLRKVNFSYIPILIHSLTYGPIHHRGQKTLEDTVAYICEHDEYFSKEFRNYNKPSIFVRITVFVYLLKALYKNCPDSEQISVDVISSLFDLDNTTRNSKSSKFANSFSHRIRNRIWQTVLLLQPNLVTEEVNELILKKIIDRLEWEGQQPSIRYLQEWLVIKILSNYPRFTDDFITVLENSFEKRPGFLVSLLSVLTHLIMHGFLVSDNHMYKCFPLLINYCMAQNFAVRLHSRLALTKLFKLCEKKSSTVLIQKYDFLHDVLFSQQSEKGNLYKNFLKLQEDFYFSVFHPINHFTLETIFHELPRLSNVATEEWIKPEYFNYQLDTKSDFVIPCFNADNDLKNSNAKSWTDKSEEESVVNENDSFDYNFQKKLCPSKCEIYDYDDLYAANKRKKNGLIVIASLIDKIPNLGGLCRTCEVFGVDQFVIGSLKYTEDKQFQNLAVSADRWVSIKEIKPHLLKEYLCSLKEEGYTLIGAEQTDDSCKLTNYVFPKKSALLLGHEKEGMPVDFIRLLDACVEIPQQGIIRSLNVHVSGAIFIWEYARQQITHPA